MDKIIDLLKGCIEEEARALSEISENLDDSYKRAVEMIMAAKGKVIISGVGKSGIIGRKIAATMSSLGTPSFFMHSDEALHGDLGMATSQDIVIFLSNSGETEEILKILSSLKKMEVPIISISGNRASTLVRQSNVSLVYKIDKEADHMNLSPTSSTVAMLAIGDALAVTLSYLKGFTSKDFLSFHPGGSLAQKLINCKNEV
jgi:arabinose-5-phosphate isomerase